MNHVVQFLPHRFTTCKMRSSARGFRRRFGVLDASWFRELHALSVEAGLARGAVGVRGSCGGPEIVVRPAYRPRALVDSSRLATAALVALARTRPMGGRRQRGRSGRSLRWRTR